MSARVLKHDGSSIPTFVNPKDPDSVLDYATDWSRLLDTGETIATSTWITDGEFTIAADSNTDTTATVWLSGGTIGNTGLLTNRVVTSAGRTIDRSFYLICAAT